MRRFAPVALALLIPITVSGQETVRSVVLVDTEPEVATPAPSWLQQELPPPGMKSPGLAAVLNLFIPYGVGNFYAGNEGHGVRHLVFGLGSAGLMVGGLVAACDGEGLTFCDEESAGYYVAGVGALGFLTNWVWGIVSGIGDAKAHNRMIREAYSLRPDQEKEPLEERDCDPLTQAERWEAYWNPEILEEWRRRCAQGGGG